MSIIVGMMLLRLSTLITLLCAAPQFLLAQTTDASISCEAHAAVVDGHPLEVSLHAILEQATARTSPTIYNVAPITGGRYWVRADYGDGRAVQPYPHIGCFADIRIAIAWFCGADSSFAKSRHTCSPSRRGQPIRLPAAGCLSMALSLREPIIYCAPGFSPDVAPLS